jgi:hypothetical protein
MYTACQNALLRSKNYLVNEPQLLIIKLITFLLGMDVHDDCTISYARYTNLNIFISQGR